jgi:hypothetical protein
VVNLFRAFTCCCADRSMVSVAISSRNYRVADKSLAPTTSRCILFDGENISFDASLVLYIYIYINGTNIPPILIISRIY